MKSIVTYYSNLTLIYSSNILVKYLIPDSWSSGNIIPVNIVQ